MRIKKEYYVKYDEDDISVMRRIPDKPDQVVCPISSTAAMAWEGFERGMSRNALIEAIVAEFDGATEDIVSAELDALSQQLIAFGYAEE